MSKISKVTRAELLEKLSELEHIQWERWAGSLMEQETLSESRRYRWSQFMVPYSELSEEDKDNDRVWAKKVLTILEEFNLI